MVKVFKIYLILVSSFILYLIFEKIIGNLFELLLPFIAMIIPFQIAAYSFILGFFDSDCLKSPQANKEIITHLEELFENLYKDTRLIILLGIFFIFCVFIIKNATGIKINEFLLKLLYCLALITFFLIFDLVWESVKVILQVSKCKLELMKKKKE